jgi:hypothetical protein
MLATLSRKLFDASLMLTHRFATTALSTSSLAAATVHHQPLRERIEHIREERRRPPNAGRPGYNEKGHKILTAEDIAEIKRLRAEDPVKWTQISLARRFECSRLQIGIHAAHPDRQRQHEVVQSIFAQRRLQRDPANRRRLVRAYMDRVTQHEHARWQEKVARTRATAQVIRTKKAEADAATAQRRANAAVVQANRQRQQVAERAKLLAAQQAVSVDRSPCMLIDAIAVQAEQSGATVSSTLPTVTTTTKAKTAASGAPVLSKKAKRRADKRDVKRGSQEPNFDE